VFAAKGLDIPSIQSFKAASRSLKAVYCEGSVCNILENHLPLTNSDLLNLDVDILIPAALENQITEDNAHTVQARYIFEVANGPVTSTADQMLEARGIQVFPDILVNAGGVTVSYFEWVQNRSGLYWSLPEVNDRLKTMMVHETDQIWAIAQQHQISPRTAAYVHALSRLGDALNAKGTRDDYISAL
jgi:glutamate dehydrogenase (NADP+)